MALLPTARLAHLTLAAALWAAWPAPVAHAQVQLPALGDSVSGDMDILAEKRLGERIMRELRRDPDFLDDPTLSEYIDALWQPLLAAARARGDIDADIDRHYGWDTFQVQDRSVNAFALPGGHVGLNLGLIGMTATSDELASVLAHELTHVTQRHIARGMANSARQSTASMAAMILGLIVASRARSADAAQAVILGSQAAAMQGQINFTREMEREADRIGLQLMTTAGFAPGGMAAMFEKLEANGRLNDNNLFPYLRSHPLTIERISEARLRMQGGAATRTPTLVWHALMQARAKALMDRSDTALQRLQAQAAPGAPVSDLPRLAQLYMAGLASMLLRDFDKAASAIQSGLALATQRFAQEPAARRAFLLLKLELPVQEGKPRGTLAAALADLGSDRSRPALLARAQLALVWQRAGDPAATPVLRNSLEDLQTWVVDHRSDALAWQMLSQVADGQGLRLRALRAGAEAAAAGGDVLGAVDRFRTAQQIAREDPASDYVETSVIQSRLRELEAERRKMMAEARGERVD